MIFVFSPKIKSKVTNIIYYYLFIVNIDIILYLKISVIYYRVENKVNCVNIKRNQEKDIVQTDSKKSIQNKRCQNLRIVSDFIPSFNGKG